MSGLVNRTEVRPKIGLFDSSWGTLPLLHNIATMFPGADIECLSDYENSPYGEKSEEDILKHTVHGLDLLYRRGCRYVFLACNTMAAIGFKPGGNDQHPRSLIKLWRDACLGQRELGVIGIVRAAAVTLRAEIAKLAEKGRLAPNRDLTVMLFATLATVNSHAYEEAIRWAYLNKNSYSTPDPVTYKRIKVVSVACPGLAGIIEDCHSFDPTEYQDGLENAVAPFVAEMAEKIATEVAAGKISPDNIKIYIPGCTHYLLIPKVFSDTLTSHQILHTTVSNLDAAAEYALHYMGKKDAVSLKLMRECDGTPQTITFLTTGGEEAVAEANDFLRFARDILKVPMPRSLGPDAHFTAISLEGEGLPMPENIFRAVKRRSSGASSRPSGCKPPVTGPAAYPLGDRNGDGSDSDNTRGYFGNVYGDYGRHVTKDSSQELI